METIVTLKCSFCGKIFERTKRRCSNHKNKKNSYCSPKCQILGLDNKLYPKKIQIVSCKNCGKEFQKLSNQINKCPNNFCSSSCAATYNNTHKTKGTRTSKLEVWLQGQLKPLYPKEEILFNDKTAINSELDIYFPRLKLAFELNGIFHYEPIYGEKKLKQIQNNDERKFLLCQQNNISLCVIDASKEKYFKEERSKKYLDIINEIIQPLLVLPQRFPVQSRA